MREQGSPTPRLAWLARLAAPWAARAARRRVAARPRLRRVGSQFGPPPGGALDLPLAAPAAPAPPMDMSAAFRGCQRSPWPPNLSRRLAGAVLDSRRIRVIDGARRLFCQCAVFIYFFFHFFSASDGQWRRPAIITHMPRGNEKRRQKRDGIREEGCTVCPMLFTYVEVHQFAAAVCLIAPRVDKDKPLPAGLTGASRGGHGREGIVFWGKSMIAA